MNQEKFLINPDDNQPFNENGEGEQPEEDIASKNFKKFKTMKHIKFQIDPSNFQSLDGSSRGGSAMRRSVSKQSVPNKIMLKPARRMTAIQSNPDFALNAQRRQSLASMRMSRRMSRRMSSVSSKYTLNTEAMREKMKEQFDKKQQNLSEEVMYRQQIGMYGSNMAVDILMKSYKFLDDLVKNSPKDSIRINVPETIICSDDQQITFLFTNKKGFLQAEYFNREEEQVSCSSDEQEEVHESLSNNAIIRIAQIADFFHEKAYLEQDYRHQRDKLKESFQPIALLKYQGDNNDNNSQLLYFPGSIIEKVMSMHQRQFFIVQRFVMNKGFCPSIIRCVVQLRHFTQIKNIEKVLQKKDEIEQQIQHQNNESSSSSSSESRAQRGTSNGKNNDLLSPGYGRNSRRRTKNQKREATFSPAAKKFSMDERPNKVVKFVNQKMSQGDNVELNLKIFKISNKGYFNGQQITDRLNAYSTATKKAKSRDGTPSQNKGKQPKQNANQNMAPVDRKAQLKFEQNCPVTRLDENFINYIIENNNFFHKLCIRKQVPAKNGAQEKMEAAASGQKFNKKTNNLIQIPVEDIFQIPDGDYIVPSHLKQPPIREHSPKKFNTEQLNQSGQIQTPMVQNVNYKSIFYRKTEIEKVINKEMKLSSYLDNDILQLQTHLQQDFNDHKKVLGRQFLIEEDTMLVNANIIETSKKVKNRLKGLHNLQSIHDQGSQDFRVALDALVKGIRSKQPLLNKLVVDFLTEPTKSGDNNIFLQMKFASVDYDVMRLDYIRTDKPPRIIKDVSDKKIQQEKQYIEQKVEFDKSGAPQQMLAKRTDFFLNTKSLINKFEKAQQSLSGIDLESKTKLQYWDVNRKPIQVICSGDYCKQETHSLEPNIWPQFHIDELIRIQSDKEKKEAGGLAVKSFIPEKHEVILPDLPYYNYKISNSLIFLDRDIRNLWSEALHIHEELEKNHTKNYHDIQLVYQDHLENATGKMYSYSSAEDKHQMKLVCYTCYVFYKVLQHKIFDEKGNLNCAELHKISDPHYAADKAKEARFKLIKDLIEQGQVGVQTQEKKEVRKSKLCDQTASAKKRKTLTDQMLKQRRQSARSYRSGCFGTSPRESSMTGEKYMVDMSSVPRKSFRSPQVQYQNQLSRNKKNLSRNDTEPLEQVYQNKNKEIFIQIQNVASKEKQMDNGVAISGIESMNQDSENLLNLQKNKIDEEDWTSRIQNTRIRRQLIEGKINQELINKNRDETFEVIFNSANDVNRPVKQSMPNIYDREKKYLMEGNDSRVFRPIHYQKCVSQYINKPPLLKKSVEKNRMQIVNKIHNKLKNLTPIRQQRRRIFFTGSKDNNINQNDQSNYMSEKSINFQLSQDESKMNSKTTNNNNNMTTTVNNLTRQQIDQTQLTQPIDICIETQGNTNQIKISNVSIGTDCNLQISISSQGANQQTQINNTLQNQNQTIQQITADGAQNFNTMNSSPENTNAESPSEQLRRIEVAGEGHSQQQMQPQPRGVNGGAQGNNQLDELVHNEQDNQISEWNLYQAKQSEQQQRNEGSEQQAQVNNNFKNIKEISQFYDYSRYQEQNKEEWRPFQPSRDKPYLVDPRELPANSLLPYADVARLDRQTKMTKTVNLYKNSYKTFKRPKYKDQLEKIKKIQRTQKLMKLQSHIKNQAISIQSQGSHGVRSGSLSTIGATIQNDSLPSLQGSNNGASIRDRLQLPQIKQLSQQRSLQSLEQQRLTTGRVPPSRNAKLTKQFQLEYQTHQNSNYIGSSRKDDASSSQQTNNGRLFKIKKFAGAMENQQQNTVQNRKLMVYQPKGKMPQPGIRSQYASNGYLAARIAASQHYNSKQSGNPPASNQGQENLQLRLNKNNYNSTSQLKQEDRSLLESAGNQGTQDNSQQHQNIIENSSTAIGNTIEDVSALKTPPHTYRLELEQVPKDSEPMDHVKSPLIKVQVQSHEQSDKYNVSPPVPYELPID